MAIIVTDLDTLLGLVIEVEDAIPDPNDYIGYWCIQHYAVQCGGCGEYVCYVEPPNLHLIVVWENKDDEDMLRMAGKLQEIELDPIVIQYAPIMGNCIPYEDCKKKK